MLKPLAFIVTGLVGALSAVQFVGAEAPRIAVIVRVSNQCGVPQHQLNTARKTAQAIFRHSGIEAEWRECPVGRRQLLATTGCADLLKPTEVVVRIIATPLSSKHQTDDGLGFSYVSKVGNTNVLATVFADAVAKVAARDCVEPGMLLGRALAHEVGHLLLGTTDHSNSGLMRASWTAAQFQRRLDWSFSRKERQQMQQALVARLKLATPPVVLAELLLIRLFQHATICSVSACRARRFRRMCLSFSVNSRPKWPASSIWRRVAGRTVSHALAVDTGVRTRWRSGAGRVPHAVTRRR